MAHWPSLAGYFGRASAILRQGKPNVDLLVLKEEDESRSDLRSALQRAGYSWDVVVDDTLESVRPPISNRLSPEGPAYQVLVIDRVSTLSGESSERLLSWARAGLPMVLIGDSPAKGASFKDVAAEDAMVQRSISDLLALPNVRRIGRTQELPAQLKALGIEPSIEAANFPGLVFQRRRTDDWDLWLIYNNDSKVFDGEVRLASKGAPQQLDLWTGFRADIPVFSKFGESTSLQMSLQSGHLKVIMFDRRRQVSPRLIRTDAFETLKSSQGTVLRALKAGPIKITDAEDGDRTIDIPSPGATIEVSKPWTLTATLSSPQGPSEVSVSLDELRDWRDIRQLNGQSGVGLYVASFTLSPEQLLAGRGFYLDIGVVNGTSRVFLNGQEVPGLLNLAGKRSVTSLLKPGQNEVRIEVATTLINKILSIAKSGDLRYLIFPLTFRSSQPYGFLGPVRLVPYQEIVVPN